MPLNKAFLAFSGAPILARMKLFIFFLLWLSVLIAPCARLQAQDSAHAQDDTQTCLIDRTQSTDGRSYTSCVAEPHNNSLREEGFSSARLERGTQNTTQPIWAYNICRFIDNRSDADDFFIPFGNATDWEQFTQKMPKWMAAFECCLPRDLKVSDIITPAQPCTQGWQLLGLYNNADYSTPIMTPAGNGFVNVADGKPAQLGVGRDDNHTFYSYNGITDFAARFRCGGPNATSKNEGVPVEENPEEGITVVGQPVPANEGDEGMVPVRMTCNQKKWKIISVRPCVETAYTYTASCEAYGYPTGTLGHVTIEVKLSCPANKQEEKVAEIKCGG